MCAMVYARDMEVVQRLKPEPMTPRETAAQDKIDDVEYDIFVHKMNMVAQEGKETTMKLGASSGMRWGDVAFGIYTAQGDLAVVATGIWFHAVLGQLPVKYIVKHYLDDESVGVKEGDSFFFNDPFYGGVHPADMGLCVPVFHEGELICFVGAVVHSGENGGTDPGGVCPRARTKYDEGFIAPPIKVGENYVLREDILAMMASMNRDARTMILDIKARLAACRIAQRRILDFASQKGSDLVVGGLRRILAVTADAARQKVSQLNDGVFRQPRFMDTVGMAEDLTKINLAVVKKGDTIKLVFEDTSPMLPDKPLNSFFQGIIGMAMVYFCGWFLHDLPANNALLAPMEWEFPEDCLLNAKGEAPTTMAPFPQTLFANAMFMAGARMTYHMDPSRAQASWFQGFGVPLFGGMNQWGEPVADITPEMNATGAGARSDQDGVNGAGAFFATMSDCSDVETTEADRPFMYLFRNYFKNSYGHGKYRGGAGIGFGMKMHHVPGVAMGCFGFGSRFPATLGIFGGYAVPPVFLSTVRQSNLGGLLSASENSLPCNLDQVYGEGNPEEGQREYHHITHPIQLFMYGDTFYVPVGGGAGYGDVLERDPQAALNDLAEGLVSEWVVDHVYKVSYDPDTLRLDEEATKARRQEAVAARLASAKPYDEFEAEWLKLSPSEDVLNCYVTYPHPKVGIKQGPLMPSL
ncbi:MAG: hydantoinase B/oxoprolinase family protein [Desulfarculaceae bacterium]|nr:hydantoinase B/oxoprolinase family protein [Desulfarculaceae bacterium]